MVSDSYCNNNNENRDEPSNRNSCPFSLASSSPINPSKAFTRDPSVGLKKPLISILSKSVHKLHPVNTKT
ncbi:MAG: hypothetical protein WKF36_04765 [Candidatus Nitrosocosmicus sp.]